MNVGELIELLQKLPKKLPVGADCAGEGFWGHFEESIGLAVDQDGVLHAVLGMAPMDYPHVSADITKLSAHDLAALHARYKEK